VKSRKGIPYTEEAKAKMKKPKSEEHKKILGHPLKANHGD
jgi:hypothetical protein